VKYHQRERNLFHDLRFLVFEKFFFSISLCAVENLTVDSANESSGNQTERRSSAFWPMMLLVVLAGGALVAIQMRRQQAANAYIGMSLPPMSAEGWLNSDGPVNAESLRGNVALVEFWSTDCPTCVREMPKLAALRERFREQGLKVVGLTFETGGDVDRVKRFVADEKIDWPIGYGAGFAFEAMGIELRPTYVLYDRAGRGVWGGHSLHGADEAVIAALAK
jgi:thiol-disulfide isomerase/thioredoxin